MFRRVSPKEAHDLMREHGYQYVDVRSIPEFEQGHPAGAVNVPLMHAEGGGMVPNDRFVEVIAANFPKDANLVLGCQAGGRSRKACTLLDQAGFTNVLDQRAGFGGARDMNGVIVEDGWQDARLPVSTTASPGTDYESLLAKVPASSET